jgi:hypothetical protein
MIQPAYFNSGRIGTGLWFGRKKRIVKDKLELSFADFLFGMVVLKSGLDKEVNLLFRAFDWFSISEDPVVNSRIMSRTVDFPTFRTREPFFVKYCLINFSDKTDYIAASFPIDSSEEEKRKINLLYSPYKGGLSEIMSLLSKNPMNPLSLNPKSCFAASYEQPYF